MILFALCLAGSALSYFLGIRNPGRNAQGTVKGWVVSITVGCLLALTFYAFSAFGLLMSFDSLLSDF
jgi:hypothetical protein